jgi:PilX N-terminal
MRNIKITLRDERGITLVVVLMVMALLLSVIGAGLLLSGVNTKMTGNYKIGTKAFYAANTGVNIGVIQLGPEPATATIAFTQNLGGGLVVRSGHRTDTSPQPLQFKGPRSEPGFSLNVGTGYNASGYAFYQYQINATGTFTDAGGTESGGREVEAQASYGPVAR